jgi:hypothetical protein
MLELGSRTRTQPAPPHVVWTSLTRPYAPGARPWLDLADAEIDPRILEADEPSLVVWSTLWPDRPDETIRFDIESHAGGCRLRWTLRTGGEPPTDSRLGHMRFRINVLINDRLRRSYGQ